MVAAPVTQLVIAAYILPTSGTVALTDKSCRDRSAVSLLTAGFVA